MNAAINELLTPEILNSIRGLELIARIIVEGFMSGGNRSRTIGSGQEFTQYRSYEPGDDVRQLDWKMYARSERYYIKQAEVETNITVKFMIDASHSMAYEENRISKLQHAKIITAALGYMARKQGDAFGLFTVNDKLIQVVQPRFEQQQFMRFLNELVSVKCEGKWRKETDIEQLFDHHRKEMIVFFTDLYDEDGDLLRFIARLKTSRNEVIVFHLMGDNELTLNFEGSLTFQDLETNGTRQTNTAVQKEAYTARVDAWIHESRSWMLERNIHYQLMLMNEPFEKSLRDFLSIRKTAVR